MQIQLYQLLILLGIPTLVPILIQFLTGRATRNIERKVNENNAMIKGMQALLRDRLRQLYLHHMEDGHIDIADKENFENMYNCYHDLGENGVMEDMYNKVMALPITKKNNKKQ